MPVKGSKKTDALEVTTVNTTPRFELPRRGNYDYLELPPHIQQLLEALYHAEELSAALDSAERHTRVLDTAERDVDRATWRWYQGASVTAWRLLETLRAEAELAYVSYLVERDEGDAANLRRLDAQRVDLAHRTETTLLRLVKTSSSLV